MTDDEAMAKMRAASASLFARVPAPLRIVAFTFMATDNRREATPCDGREAYRAKCYRGRTAIVVPLYYPDTRST